VSQVVPTAELEDTVAETVSQFESSSSTVVSLLKDRMAAPGDTYGRDEWSTVAERELDDMRTAVRQGDTGERLSAFRSDG
jgi:hypothetical protein